PKLLRKREPPVCSLGRPQVILDLGCDPALRQYVDSEHPGKGPGTFALSSALASRSGALTGPRSVPGLTLDERDRLVERRPAGTDIRHRNVLVPDGHAAEEDELRRG